MSESLSEIFAQSARDEFHHTSPLYERLALGIAQDPTLLNLAAHCRKGERVPVLFLAGVHYLLLSGVKHSLGSFYKSIGGAFDGSSDPFNTFCSFCSEHADQLRNLIASRRVQTNEVSRCAGLMPVFVEAAKHIEDRPFFVVDIGASAGLNLCWDHYGYKYGDNLTAGLTSSPVQIECEIRGNKMPILPESFPTVAGRVGVDVNPLKVSDAEDMLWLRALVWPEHEKRAKLLRNAIEVTRRQTLTILAGDGVEKLRDVMNLVPQDSVLCVMRVFTQISKESRQRWNEIVAQYGATHDLMMITGRPHSGDDTELVLTSFVKGKRTEQGLAYMQNHGDWIEWLSR